MIIWKKYLETSSSYDCLLGCWITYLLRKYEDIVTLKCLSDSARLISCVLLFVTQWTVACWLLCPWNFPGRNTGVGCQKFVAYGLYYAEVCTLHAHFLESFLVINRCWTLSKVYCASNEMIILFLFFNLLM